MHLLRSEIAYWRARGITSGLMLRALQVGRILRRVLPSEDIADNMTLLYMRPLVRWRMMSPYRVLRMAQDEAAMFMQSLDALPVTYAFDRELRMGGRVRYGGNMVRLMTQATRVVEYQGVVKHEEQGRRTFTLAEGGLRTEEEAERYNIQGWMDNIFADVEMWQE